MMPTTVSRWVFPGMFVVGLLPEIADIPPVGSASCSGHAGATIHTGGAAYAAVGGFSMDWNFGTRTGLASLSNLDSRDYAAAGLAAPVGNPRDSPVRSPRPADPVRPPAR